MCVCVRGALASIYFCHNYQFATIFSATFVMDSFLIWLVLVQTTADFKNSQKSIYSHISKIVLQVAVLCSFLLPQTHVSCHEIWIYVAIISQNVSFVSSLVSLDGTTYCTESGDIIKHMLHYITKCFVCSNMKSCISILVWNGSYKNHHLCFLSWDSCTDVCRLLHFLLNNLIIRKFKVNANLDMSVVFLLLALYEFSGIYIILERAGDSLQCWIRLDLS